MQVFSIKFSLTSGFTWEVKKHQLTGSERRYIHILIPYAQKESSHINILRLKVACLVLSWKKNIHIKFRIKKMTHKP